MSYNDHVKDALEDAIAAQARCLGNKYYQLPPTQATPLARITDLDEWNYEHPPVIANLLQGHLGSCFNSNYNPTSRSSKPRYITSEILQKFRETHNLPLSQETAVQALRGVTNRSRRTAHPTIANRPHYAVGASRPPHR